MAANNVDEFNKIISSIMVDSANLEEKLKVSEKENKELKEELETLKKESSINESYKTKFNEIILNFTKKEEEAKLLGEEVSQKAIQIKELQDENKKLELSQKELNQKIKDDEKLIQELNEIKKNYEEQNVDLLKESKNKLEQEKIEFEKNMNELKKNYEEEKKKYRDLDESFYKYKKEIQKIREDEVNKVKELENELKETKEFLNDKKLELDDTKIKLKETMDVVKKLQNENENIKTLSEEIKTESFKKVEEMKEKMEKASKEVFSNEKIFNIVADNMHNIYAQEFSFSFDKIIENILKNFISISLSVFNNNDNSENKHLHCEETISQMHLKDIYFYIYFYVLDVKKTSGGLENMLSISKNDFSDDIINNLSNEIYNMNMNNKSQKSIDEYINTLKKLGVDDESFNNIKQLYLKKNEQFKIYLLNVIKSLVKKCADTIRNSTIEINNKVIYDFRCYDGNEYTFNKNILQIDNKKLNNRNVEIILNKIKYPKDKINRIQFSGNFNSDLSEYNIQRIFLYIMIYIPELLSFSLNTCENITNSILEYIMFIVQNLKNLRVLSLESDKINDQQVKEITVGIQDHLSIVGLLLRKNNITSNGAIYLAEYISHNTNVRQLFLGFNKILGNGLKNLLNVMTTSNKYITNLDLSYNGFTINEFNILIEYFKANPILNSLDISGNELDLKSSVNLGAVLSSIKNIRNINMSNMKIISDTTPILFKSFNSEDIILDNNNLEEVGLIMLSKALAGNKNLKKLSLKSTKLSSIGLTNLLGVLVKIKEFKELHLENNSIDDMGINIIITTLKSNTFKIFVSKELINTEIFKNEALGKESYLVMVETNK